MDSRIAELQQASNELEVGDVVRVGKRGKVEWTITEVEGTFFTATIKSEQGTVRQVPVEKLTFIRKPQPVSEDRNDHRSSSYGMAILQGLQNKLIYQGTVTTKNIADRRKAGKVAKQSRKANR